MWSFKVTGCTGFGSWPWVNRSSGWFVWLCLKGRGLSGPFGWVSFSGTEFTFISVGGWLVGFGVILFWCSFSLIHAKTLMPWVCTSWLRVWVGSSCFADRFACSASSLPFMPISYTFLWVLRITICKPQPRSTCPYCKRQYPPAAKWYTFHGPYLHV